MIEDYIMTEDEKMLIERIDERAVALLQDSGFESGMCLMSVCLVHTKVCPLDLQKLLDFDDFNFNMMFWVWMTI